MPGNGDTLSLAAGELAGTVVHAVAEPDGVEQLMGLVALVRGDLSVEVSDKLELLDRGERREKVGALEDQADVLAADCGAASVWCVGEILPVDENLAVDRPTEKPGNSDEGGLAGPGGTGHGDEFAGSDRQVGAVEDRVGPVRR